jgi:CheY-like chemotaxis protein/nitrogen-specific signal transduction histidine kinase
MARLRKNKATKTKRPKRQSRAARPASRAGGGVLPVFAHDIRTALTGILALSELLASSNLGERERRWAAGIKVSAEHLAALTTLMIDAARADAATLTLQQEVFRPARIVEALRETLAARAENKGLQVVVTGAETLPAAMIGDAVRLRAALENLIDNAVKFTAQGTIRLDARANEAGRGHAELVFDITDTGIGLSKAEVKRLFRPFAQASATTARRYGGAGLGLSIVKLLARRMGGDLTLTSAPDRGSRFRFSALLRLAPAAAIENAGPSRGTAPMRRLKLLCVEDNPYGRVILNTILTELGHHADFATTGEDSVTAAAQGYDVLLMDITLPGIDGLEATRRIRALGGKDGRTPIIGISGRSESGDEAAARSAGMNFFLCKPLSPSALRDALAAVVASG